MPRGGHREGSGRPPWTEEQKAAARERNAAKRAAKAGTKAPSTAVVAQPAAKPRPVWASEVVLEIIKQSQESSRRKPRTMDWNPFQPLGRLHRDCFPPGAVPQNKKLQLAMDSNLNTTNTWASQSWMAGGIFSNVASEGLLFLGYPYLSQLAQRPEFRLFGEIRAEEMTRKWIKYRGTDDESTKEKGKKSNKTAGAQDFAPSQQNVELDPRDDPDKAKGRSDSRNKEIETKIKELEDYAKDLKLRDWFKAAAAQDSFFGISHLLLDLKDADNEDRNNPALRHSIGNGRDEISKVKLEKGCLKGIRTIEPIWCYPTTYNASNPLIPTWYDPQVWYVMGTEIHKTRILSFIGRPVPDILKPAYAFGGLAMTQMAQPYVDIWLRTRESVGEIIHAFSVMVLSTNLATTTMPGGAGGGPGDVLARVNLFNQLRDNQGAFVIDKDTEEFTNVSAPISGLSDLQAQAQEHLCSVARLPAVKYTGIQPKGLNATSEGEMRAFYDTIVGEQNHLFGPHLTSVLDIMQVSLWGARDPDITFEFVPLWELTEKEKSEKRKADMEVDIGYLDGGILSQEEIRTKLANDPESGYDGIDPDDTVDLLSEEERGLEPQGGRPQPQAEIGEEEQGNKPAAEDDDPTASEARRQAIVTAGGEVDDKRGRKRR
jgi:uncharacterized protein